MSPETSGGSTGEQQAPARGPPGGEPTGARRPDTWTLSDADLRGRAVVTSDGQQIGTVMEIQIDVGTWHVSSIEVKVDRPMYRTLGMKREMLHRTTVGLPTQLVHSVKDSVILTASTAELRHRVSDEASAH
jgi:sporulation protein YlmC with PRC-barrel domain